MDVRRLQPEEPAVRQFVEALWLPYHRELERTVEAHALEDGADVVDEEVEFRRDWLDDEDRRLWIAEEGGEEDAEVGGEPAGFVAVEVERAPSVFDQPDRLLIADLYVREAFRGSGLARDLVERAASWGQEQDCSELLLDVDVGNERAAAFYEKLGFEPHRQTLTRPIERL